jgi:predicted membrane channel-forming protein YqfA (hemolysin III family)
MKTSLENMKTSLENMSLAGVALLVVGGVIVLFAVAWFSVRPEGEKKPIHRPTRMRR